MSKLEKLEQFPIDLFFCFYAYHLPLNLRK